MSDFSLTGRAARFLGEPSSFSGKIDENPVGWLKKMDRIRKGAGLNDDDASLVVGSHLKGLAEIWWSLNEEKVKTWMDFEMLFKQKFCRLSSAIIWQDIHNLRQDDGESVEGVALKLRQLFSPINSNDDTPKVWLIMTRCDWYKNWPSWIHDYYEDASFETD